MKSFQMDFRLWISVISVTFSWIFCSVLSAPAAETSAVSAQRHVRNKRCSCANFLDKECVYFCHLDIIWVNTPERVVSYGLGYAPRAKRAVLDSPGTGGGSRCRCIRENDQSCTNFCFRLELAADARMSPTRDDKHAHRRNTGATERSETVNNHQAWPRAALRTRTLLEKWAVRRHHRARPWKGESTAS
ncbi:endothelin-1 [Nothobranchius furzeri]|uniref:Endothelin-1 n=5 Tax=Nothobranchius TaxID=28779 RepID=A0A8C6PU64_NOTFU|nr:endothelin-1 [Nothobranchius furzeri]KAF7211407.1 endothelin-1-like [Nothobranchius furzeri]